MAGTGHGRGRPRPDGQLSRRRGPGACARTHPPSPRGRCRTEPGLRPDPFPRGRSPLEGASKEHGTRARCGVPEPRVEEATMMSTPAVAWGTRSSRATTASGTGFPRNRDSSAPRGRRRAFTGLKPAGLDVGHVIPARRARGQQGIVHRGGRLPLPSTRAPTEMLDRRPAASLRKGCQSPAPPWAGYEDGPRPASTDRGPIGRADRI